MYPKCKFKEAEVKHYFEKVTPDSVAKSLRRPSLSFSDFMNLLSPAASTCVQDMRRTASRIRKMHFGKTVRLYSPLYLSNYCINNCVYCGFRKTHNVQRRRLTLEEIISEAYAIRGFGIESLLLVSGEDPKGVPIGFLETAVLELKKIFSYISIEIYPLDLEGYRRLFNAGVHGLTLYQETYNRELYKKLHREGPKSDYDARLQSIVNGAKSGFYNVGLGALLGLYDWRIEAVSMAAHALWLRKNFWKSKVQFSFPRITPIEGGFSIPAEVSESELEQMMLAFRIFFHEADIYISTRETPEFRKKVAVSCASHLSAASKVIPGGYTEFNEQDLGQFSINDTRSVLQVQNDMKEMELETVFKDWDNCLG